MSIHHLSLSNCRAFNHLHRFSINIKQLATDLHLLTQLTKIGFPGWPETDPRLGYRFRGVNYEEGGLHRPPFSFLSSTLRWFQGHPHSVRQTQGLHTPFFSVPSAFTENL